MKKITYLIKCWLQGKKCLGGCGYQEPYGFVPEADCPIHDVDKFLKLTNL